MSGNLHEYHSWRKSIVPLSEGTILLWNQGYDGLTLGSSIKSGTYMKIIKLTGPVVGEAKCNADKIYHLVSCSKNGVEFKKQHRISVEGIAKYIKSGQMEVV